MKQFGLFTLIGAVLLLQGCYSPMNALEKDLALGFSDNPDIKFVGHESIERQEADNYGNEKYLILDFENDDPFMNEQDLQASINQICKTVFGNQDLIKNLSDQGYDMVSVSFDLQSQYDCL